MILLRSRRGRLIHAAVDIRLTLCNRRADGWLIDLAERPTCPACLEAMGD